jgi:hypothetical protein
MSLHLSFTARRGDRIADNDPPGLKFHPSAEATAACGEAANA